MEVDDEEVAGCAATCFFFDAEVVLLSALTSSDGDNAHSDNVEPQDEVGLPIKKAENAHDGRAGHLERAVSFIGVKGVKLEISFDKAHFPCFVVPLSKLQTLEPIVNHETARNAEMLANFQTLTSTP